MPCMPARGRGMRFQTPKKLCRRNHTRAQVLVAKTFPRRSHANRGWSPRDTTKYLRA